MAPRPTLRFIDPEILSRIKGMDLRARTVVEGFLSGLHRSPYTGFSIEFAEYRQYTPGDDPRHIDWKVFGRSDRYYVKQYEDETNLQCNILLDLSGSMAGTSGAALRREAQARVSKFDYARYLAASLAYFIFQQRDALGMVAFDEDIRLQIPAKFRPGHLLNMLRELETLAVGTSRTSNVKVLHQIAEGMKRKGMVVLISDFFCDLTPLASAFEHLRFRGHDVLAFQVMDDFELNFDFNRLTRFVGLENETALLGMPQALREAYLQNLQAHQTELKRLCGVNRIDYTLLRSSQPLDFALHAYLASRSQKI
ncbi:DUF58 domain-containing protein [bacterium]|nr:DUF58 domain-containing protein [bacterium]NUM74548.1 DUF58 domain-containing protein [candidate division KSB1 bacterium]